MSRFSSLYVILDEVSQCSIDDKAEKETKYGRLLLPRICQSGRTSHYYSKPVNFLYIFQCSATLYFQIPFLSVGKNIIDHIIYMQIYIHKMLRTIILIGDKYAVSEYI